MKVSMDSRRFGAWAQILAKVITLGTMVVCVVGIIGYSYDLYRHGRKKHLVGWFSSAGFVLLTIPISIRLIVMHLTHWNKPNIQKYVVRIIWMVPIYSVESWLALRFKDFALYIETLRECYEAYVIFSFLYFLIALLGDEQQIIAKLKEKPASYGNHLFPVNYIASPWIMGSDFLSKCKLGVLQYVVIKNLISLVTFILESARVYGEGKFYFTRGYLYVCVVNNISQLWALYCLVQFYRVTKEELSPWRPVGKFLCVKMVVFFTWWQSIAVSILLNLTNVLSSDGSWTNRQISQGLQDYLICIEMFLASLAFTSAFTYKDYAQAKLKDEAEIEETKPFLSAFFQSSMPDDILEDLQKMVQGEAISSIFESKTEQSIGTTGSTVKTSTTVKKVGKTVPDLELQLGDSASGLSSSRTRHDLSGHSDDSLVAASHTAELIREKSDSGRANATNVTATNVSTSVSSCPAPMLGSGMKLPSKWLSLNFGSTEETKIESVHTSQGGPLVHNYTKQ